MSAEIRKPSINTKPYDAISVETLIGSLTGRVVVLTGAGGGLGRGECVAFAKAGAKLALLDIECAASALQDTVNDCVALGAEVKSYFCNVMDAVESRKTLKQIVADLGEVDVLVNNAGGTIDRPFHMETFDQFWAMIDLNFKAPMLWTHMLIPEFRRRGHGRIINIASRSATVNSPFSANYAAAKAALVRANGCLQFEQDMDGFHDIEIYSLHPGATKTGIQKALDQDVAEAYPAGAAAYAKFTKAFKCEPALCGQTCVFLAAGRGTALKGRYFDCEQDVGYVASMGGVIREQGLYELKVEFLGGLPNDGGTMPDSMLNEL
ncbi:hypothetical protein V501_08656 [Pseudogymnoascus sp. VKM F-4519 (FW-2642)]|nr:hypothetical protein V501_08656 [Pseudogymnoascus sp. VKM F-4519 (FW-2642)]